MTPVVISILGTTSILAVTQVITKMHSVCGMHLKKGQDFLLGEFMKSVMAVQALPTLMLQCMDGKIGKGNYSFKILPLVCTCVYIS